MPDLTYISLGAGVQSTSLLAMSALGDHNVPRADVAIFADTQSEIADTYRHLDLLERWAAERGIEVRRVTRGSLERVSLMQEKSPDRTDQYFTSIPAFTFAPGDASEGRLRRQCTREFKVEAINREVRRLLGYDKGDRIAGNSTALGMIGISLDEAVRMKPSQVPWIDHAWPLVDARLTRRDCIAYLERVGLPVPVKSACYFCPYHDDRYWAWLKRERPLEWRRAVDFDQAIRDSTRAGAKKPIFLHRSCLPLGDVDVEAGAAKLEEVDRWRRAQGTLWDNFTEECEGMCGV